MPPSFLLVPPSGRAANCLRLSGGKAASSATACICGAISDRDCQLSDAAIREKMAQGPRASLPRSASSKAPCSKSDPPSRTPRLPCHGPVAGCLILCATVTHGRYFHGSVVVSAEREVPFCCGAVEKFRGPSEQNSLRAPAALQVQEPRFVHRGDV